jgi:hypothetical protein
MRFCQNCGANLTTTAELAPTVFAMSPPIAPNQQNFAPIQSPPQVWQPPEQQYQQQFPPQVSSSRKSNAKKFVIIGGIIGLLMLLGSGFALWRNVIEPRLLEARRLKTETDNQNRADSMTAMSLMPAQFDYSGAAGDVYRRKETLDKLRLLQATQNLPTELKQKISEVNDAAAAVYISDKKSNQKVLLQIFKFNTPEQAVAVCRQMVDEIEKNRDRFKTVHTFRASIRPSYCNGRVEGKNNENLSFESLYGFLYVSSGNEKDPVSGAKEEVSKQLDPY